jgi:hypothetical protein
VRTTLDAGVCGPAFAAAGDLDGDGDDDILVGLGFLTCLLDPFTAACGGLIGFENEGGRFTRFDVIAPGDPLFFHSGVLADIDGDGDLDVAGAEFFREAPASFAWFEQTAAPGSAAPAGRWRRHVITDAHGPAIELRIVPDASVPGGVRHLGTNHVNNAPDGGCAQHVLEAELPQAGAMLVEDLDGDGRSELVVSGYDDNVVFVYTVEAP